MNELDRLISDERILYQAYKKSCRNRSYKTSAMKFSLDVFTNLRKLQDELLNRTYRIKRYTRFKVYEPKEREILACLFRDKVVQHILCDNILCPKLKNICIVDNYAGQIGKGTKFARERTVYHMMKHYEQCGMEGYIYRGDISKYYYNIDHEIAKDIMHKHYPGYTHWLIDLFIDSTENPGIALGNQINTVVSNLYLHELDVYVTRKLEYVHYGRYADDFWIIDSDKERLKENVEKIKNFIGTLKLNLNSKSQMMPFKNGIKFVGFHFYVRGGKMEIRLDNGKKRAYRRKFNRMIKRVSNNELTVEQLLKSYYSWKAHASNATSYKIFNYYEKQIKELILNMTINNGYYIADCTSKKIPISKKDGNTFYLPVNIRKNEQDLYEYEEYRFNIPIDYKFPVEILEYMAESLDEYRKSLEEVGVI